MSAAPMARRFKAFSELKAIAGGGAGEQVDPPRLRIILDKRGRKGKVVTIILGLQHNPQTIEDVARELKVYCGAGGTVKGRTIEVQGDQRARVTEKLRSMNYFVTE